MTELVSQALTNMQNGISQQTPALRYSSQCEDQENCRNDPVDGMGKRYNSVMKGTVSGITNPEDYRIETVERDAFEKYKFFIKDGTVKVIDAKTGVSYPVNIGADELTYLTIQGSLPASRAFQLLNTVDTTFVVNKTIPVKRIKESVTPRAPEAVWYLKQADYKTTYEVRLNGYAAYITTPEATSEQARDGLDTRTMTANMAAAINALTGSHGCTAVRYGNVLHIKRNANDEFTIEAHDDLGDRASYALKGWVADYNTLPPNAVEGFRIEVRGTTGDVDVEPYHAVYTELDTDGNKITGIWKETLKHGVDKKLDLKTMPLSIKRTQESGNVTGTNPLGITFWVTSTAFEERVVGDDATAPFPSFVSEQDSNGNVTLARHIQAMVFHENRLCFVSDENLIFSEAGEYMNFFPTTVITEIDSDPIDIALNLNHVAPVEHVLISNGEMFLFAPEVQLKVRSGEVFNAPSLDVSVASRYQIDMEVAPFVSGSVMYFWAKGASYSVLYEYIPQGDSNRYVALEMTAHVPRYVAGKVQRTLSVQSENMMFTLVRDKNNAPVKHLYVTNTLLQGNERVQNAWQKWTFEGEVLDITTDQDVLTLLMKYNDGLYIEEIVLSHSPLKQELGHPVFLDRREEVDVNFALPGGDTRVIFEQGGRYWTGFRYNQKYTFSEFFLREDRKAVIGGRLQLRYLTLQFYDTTEFTVTVLRSGVDSRVKRFDGRVLDASANILGKIPVTAGTERFPIHTKSGRASITITNDTETDAVFQTAEWEGTYTRRNRRT